MCTAIGNYFSHRHHALGLVACHKLYANGFRMALIPFSLLMSKNRSQSFVHFLFPFHCEVGARNWKVGASSWKLPFFLFRSASPFIPKNWLAMPPLTLCIRAATKGKTAKLAVSLHILYNFITFMDIDVYPKIQYVVCSILSISLNLMNFIFQILTEPPDWLKHATILWR